MPSYICTPKAQEEAYIARTAAAPAVPLGKLDDDFDWGNCLGNEKEKEQYAQMLLKVTGLEYDTIAKIIAIQTSHPANRSAQDNAFLKEIATLLRKKFASLAYSPT